MIWSVARRALSSGGLGGAKTLGFIGVGNMGAGMAANLLRAGYRLVFCDPKADQAAETLSRMGATQAATPADVATTPGGMVDEGPCAAAFCFWGV